ncbi:MAG: FprA family A-type flavoprotein [Candidatus Bathyarchaeota archaeon]|nr:FprA family A-type flavoprotein [Candidatus Bathyarchaeota archaeon]
MDKTLKEGVHWVGVVDWNIRDFHGYITKRGTTYNAYLIEDEKTVLVDTVKHTFCAEYLSNIAKLVDLEKIDYIIVNHVEMDHSGSLPFVAAKAKNATIISSERGKEAIIEHYGDNFKIQTVKTGDELKIGKRTLKFIEAPMLHWPDSMFTYIVEDQILMSNDAFGQHLASSKRFDDEVDEHVLMEEAATYYANILMALGPLIARKIQEVVQLGISPTIIAPSHGVIWRSKPAKIINAYSEWSAGVCKPKVVIIYDTMWGSTDKMARAIAEGVASQGVEVRVLKLRASDNTAALTEILDAKAVVVGSPTINNGIFPTVGSFLTYVTGLKPKDKLWYFFGSFGWGGGAVRGMIDTAKKANFAVHEPALEVKYVPGEEALKKCFDLGNKIAHQIKA